jgi:hypothetical protein
LFRFPEPALFASFGNDQARVRIWGDDLLIDGQPALWVGFGADDEPTLLKLLADCESEFPNPQWIESDEEWQKWEKHIRTAPEEVIGQPTVMANDDHRVFGVYRRWGDVGLQAASDFIERVLRSLPEYRVAEDADARETSIWMMANQAEQTARNSNGQTVEHTIRARELRMPTQELVERIKQLLIAQENKCALTGISLQFHGAHIDKNLIMSLDRIDSEGHYERGTCKSFADSSISGRALHQMTNLSACSASS